MSEKIGESDKRSLLKRFLIKAGIAFVSWIVVYYAVILPDGRLNAWLTQLVVQGTTIGLELLGYSTLGQGNIVLIDNQPVVLVADNCNGLELFALYVGFILCFPGPVRYKLIFIPLGLIAIFLINVLREIVLSLNYKYFQETFDFNHKYTYVFIVYLAVFGIWRYWLNSYSILKRKN